MCLLGFTIEYLAYQPYFFISLLPLLLRSTVS